MLPRLPMTAAKFCIENFFTYSLWYDKFTIQNSWMVLNVFIEKKLTKFVQKLQVWCNTDVLIFTSLHYAIAIQASFTNPLLNLEFHYVLCKVNCLLKWNETEKFYVSFHSVPTRKQSAKTTSPKFRTAWTVSKTGGCLLFGKWVFCRNFVATPFHFEVVASQLYLFPKIFFFFTHVSIGR